MIAGVTSLQVMVVALAFGLVLGVTMGLPAMIEARKDARERKERELDLLERQTRAMEQHPPFDRMSGDSWMSEVIGRLLDAALPPRAPEPMDGESAVRHQAEYEPPIPEVNDWTDPFFGLPRETVGGLRPGEGIPGIGQDAGDVVDEGGPMDNRVPVGDWPDVSHDAAALELYEQWVEETQRDG